MNTSLPSVLVFPINMAQSVDFARTARDIGLKVFAATSETITPLERSEGVVYLPYVTHPTFDQEFLSLLAKESITLVYTPHLGIWRHIGLLAKQKLTPIAFHLCNESPLSIDWRPYDSAYAWAESCLEDLALPTGIPRVALSRYRYASLYRSYNGIPGQSDADKIWLLTQIARYAPQGDIVEIGSSYGRSAFTLSWLARFHDIGAVVCVDPWDLVSSQDQGAEAALINEAVKSINWNNVFSVFCASVSIFDNVSYIRQPSRVAINKYKDSIQSGKIETEELGVAFISGSISILHIDGNHKYEEVQKDIDDWLPLVCDGGWVLIDDYLWAFGDGPKRAGDKILDTFSVKTSFVVGDTLCIQM